MDSFITYVVFFLFSCIVVYLVLWPRERQDQNKRNEKAIDAFKSNSDRFLIQFEDCDFRDSSFKEEVEEDTSGVHLAASLVGGGMSGIHYRPLVDVERIRSVLFYRNVAIFGGARIYQTFDMDVDALKFYVLDQKVALYVLKDKSYYLFDVEV